MTIWRKVVVAPDSFKGTMNSTEVCNIITLAFRDHSPTTEVVRIPIADGGEGTVDAYLQALGGELIHVQTQGPLGDDMEATYGILPGGRIAIVEVAAASGLSLVEGRKDPLHTTSHGTGVLIRDALGRGVTKIILGIGGSATNDGGIGLASALGIRFLDALGDPVQLNGTGLANIERIDVSGMDPRLAACDIEIACDVDNPLCGPTGASLVFGPQKGASREVASQLDKNLSHFADTLVRYCGHDVRCLPGTGAAGGMAVPLLCFANAALKPGIGLLLEAVEFDRALSGADLVITGEGRMDSQSLRGKAPVGVAERALRSGVPAIAVVGSIGNGYEGVFSHGIHAVFSTCCRIASLQELRSTCRNDLYETIANLIRFALCLPLDPNGVGRSTFRGSY